MTPEFWLVAILWALLLWVGAIGFLVAYWLLKPTSYRDLEP